MNKTRLDIEAFNGMTISTTHLHPSTIDLIEMKKGDIEEGPSIALREEGYLLNSGLGCPGISRMHTERGLFDSFNDRYPDLCMIMAIARGQGKEWINIDQDGVEYVDILPDYHAPGSPEMPDHPIWEGAMISRITTPNGPDMLKASLETLELLAGEVEPEDPSPV